MFCVHISFVQYVVSMIVASIHLMFTEPLSVDDAAKYYRDNPRAPAEPLMWFFCAFFWHVIATTLLFQASHHAGWTYVLWTLGGVLWLVKVWHESSVWSPKSRKHGVLEPLKPSASEDPGGTTMPLESSQPSERGNQGDAGHFLV
jgi:hypothetical protein